MFIKFIYPACVYFFSRSVVKPLNMHEQRAVRGKKLLLSGVASRHRCRVGCIQCDMDRSYSDWFLRPIAWFAHS